MLRGCETCLAWVKRHQDSAYGFCYFGPQAIERHWNDWCLQWQERGNRDPRVVWEAPDPPVLTRETIKEAVSRMPVGYGAYCYKCAFWEPCEGGPVGVCMNEQSDNNGNTTARFDGCEVWERRDVQEWPSVACPDCGGAVEDIGHDAPLTVWQCKVCERVTAKPCDVSDEFRAAIREWAKSKNNAAPSMISTYVYAVEDDGIANLFATRELAEAWREREKEREQLEDSTIERYTLWHEIPPEECSWCDATGDLTSVVWKSEGLLLCSACLAKCTGKAASDE